MGRDLVAPTQGDVEAVLGRDLPQRNLPTVVHRPQAGVPAEPAARFEVPHQGVGVLDREVVRTQRGGVVLEWQGWLEAEFRQALYHGCGAK